MQSRATRSLFFALSLFSALATGISYGATATNKVVGAVPGNFGVSLSGSSSYSLPIKIAPGAAGTQPQIQVNYDSQRLSGPLGAGWSLGGTSAITRGPKDNFVDGFIQGLNLDDDDGLYLDGQRIVPVGPSTGVGKDKKIKYRKTDDDFTEIVRYGDSLERSYFRVRSKGGVTLVFGNPSVVNVPTASALDKNVFDATIQIHSASSNTDLILAFAESAVVDTAGNIIYFRYKQEGKGDYNIDEILYTAHGSIDENAEITEDAPPFASVSFVYAPAVAPEDVYVAGALLEKNVTLTDLYSCVSTITDSDIKISYPFDCKAEITKKNALQVAHYTFDYKNTETASRQVLASIHMFGTDDAIEVQPTKFNYTPMRPGWDLAQNVLPSGLTLADTNRVARGYHFAHVVPPTGGGLDLLFAAQINKKNVAFAFQNAGPSSWSTGGQPWTLNGQIDPVTGAISGFAPPVPFVDEDGSDLGVIVADIDGSGRASILQNFVRSGQTSKSAYLPGATQYEKRPEYAPPFTVSKDGKIVAEYKIAKWAGSGLPDLVYETEGTKGFLLNGGPGVGWQSSSVQGLDPRLPLGSGTFIVDLGCPGGVPALLGRIENDDHSHA
jgi:hypothetical protein